MLERFLVDSSKLVTALAERRDDLAGLVGNLNDTTRALGNQKARWPSRSSGCRRSCAGPTRRS